MNDLEKASAVAAAGVLATSTQTARAQAADELVAKIKSTDEAVRTEAWQSAGGIGAPAVKPLAVTMLDKDLEVARAAKRGLWKIVHTVGRPGNDAERKAVVAELIPALKSEVVVRREILWMLSEIGGDESVDSIAALLADKEVREAARAALQRIPTDKSLAALKAALETAPEEFRFAIAESLRDRGVTVQGYPSRKLTRSKETTVKPE